jgi:hypothetical protein
MTCILFLAISGVGQVGQVLEFPPLQAYRHTCPISTRYDRFTDRSIYPVNLGRLMPRGRPDQYLLARQEFKGPQRRAADESLVISLVFFTPSFYFSSPSPLSFLGNQEVFFVFEKGRIERREPQGQLGGIRRGGDQSYTASVSLGLREFLDLVNSGWVECRYGEHEYRLSAEQMAGLRDFAARMAFDDATVRAKLQALQVGPDAGRAPNPKNAARRRSVLAAPDGAHLAETRLRMALELEKHGNESAAIERYREVVEKYPGTPQAKAAQDRLKAIRPEKGS